MAEFSQPGTITTLHNLGNRPLVEIEQDLIRFSRKKPMTLILPSLFSELEGPALNGIIDILCEVPYINQIIIGLDRADYTQFETAREFFSRLPQDKKILWNDGPRLRELDEKLKPLGLSPQQEGKGRNVWFCLGYVLAAGNARAVATHDCDILTYDRELPARLFYPVANPGFEFVFGKGYYARINGRQLSGRVNRLFVIPLVKTLKKVLGSMEYLEFLESFRYPLSGEFSMRTELIPSIRIPSDWGLEVGMLSEIYRHVAPRHVCQVDIADNYDHKHQEMNLEDRSTGLAKMSHEIAKSIFRKLATEGSFLDASSFRTIKAAYFRNALDMLERFEADAVINGLEFDRHAEEKAVELFSQSLIDAGEVFLSNPMEVPFIPNWNRVFSAIPEFGDLLLEAVELDNQ